MLSCISGARLHISRVGPTVRRVLLVQLTTSQDTCAFRSGFRANAFDGRRMAGAFPRWLEPASDLIASVPERHAA